MKGCEGSFCLLTCLLLASFGKFLEKKYVAFAFFIVGLRTLSGMFDCH